MGALAGILAGIAAEIGAPLVRDILTKRIGATGGALAETVIRKVAEKAGAQPEALETLPPDKLSEAIMDVETEAPEMLALYQVGLEGQFALLQAEAKEGFWQSAWRWGWMYLLGLFWTCLVLVFPLIKALTGVAIDSVDIAIVMTLTTWFISLYMGGHTVKALGESAIEAVKNWRSSKP